MALGIACELELWILGIRVQCFCGGVGYGRSICDNCKKTASVYTMYPFNLFLFSAHYSVFSFRLKKYFHPLFFYMCLGLVCGYLIYEILQCIFTLYTILILIVIGYRKKQTDQ